MTIQKHSYTAKTIITSLFIFTSSFEILNLPFLPFIISLVSFPEYTTKPRILSVFFNIDPFNNNCFSDRAKNYSLTYRLPLNSYSSALGSSQVQVGLKSVVY